MARKSKEAILKETLRSISDCPCDIFDIIEPTDDLFEKIDKAESGDLDSIEELIELLFNSGEDKTYDSLIYFICLGCECSSLLAANRLIECIAKRGYPPELYTFADAVLCGEKSNNDLQAKEALLLYAIKTAAISHKADDVKKILERISSLDAEYERLYVIGCLLRLGADVEDDSSNLLSRLDICELSALKSFSGSSGNIQEFDSKKVKHFYDVAKMHDIDIWRDFWLRCAYEYVTYSGESLAYVLDMALEFSLGRKYSEKKNLYALALCKYGMENAPDNDKPTYSENSETYKRLCRFDGFDISDIDVHKLIKEAVYLDTESEKERMMRLVHMGTPILHAKNRYTLSATLKNHIKRGKKHLWHTKLCFPKGKKSDIPVFSAFAVTETRPIITRGGISLPQNKAACQVICYCEISIDGQNHPFTLDLILDISYVSATKCAGGDISVKQITRENDSYVLSVDIALY